MMTIYESCVWRSNIGMVCVDRKFGYHSHKKSSFQFSPHQYLCRNLCFSPNFEFWILIFVVLFPAAVVFTRYFDAKKTISQIVLSDFALICRLINCFWEAFSKSTIYFDNSIGIANRDEGMLWTIPFNLK